MARKTGQNSVPWTDYTASPITFSWNHTEYRLKYGFASGRAFADLAPCNDAISGRVIARLERDPRPLWERRLSGETTEIAELLHDMEP